MNVNTVKRSTEHAWHRYFDRERARDRKPFTPSIDFDAIVYVAEDYLYARGQLFAERVKNGYARGTECPIYYSRNDNVRDAVARYDAAHDELASVCRVTGVPYDAAIAAARARMKWYARTEMRCYPDPEKLLRAMA